MRLEYAQFSGIAPGIAPRKLAAQMATIADNCRFDRGRVDPWPGILDVQAAPMTAVSLFPYQGSYLFADNPRSYVKRVYPNDINERIIYTGDEYPVIKSGASEFRLGIPRPTVAPTAVTTDPGDQSVSTNVENWFYVETLVDVWGAEGRPSAVSNKVTVGLNAIVDLSLSPIPAGNYNFGVGALRRIYRTNAAGNNLAYFQFVAEIPIANTMYQDTTASGDLEEVLASASWYEPPNDDAVLFPGGPLQGICKLPGDFLAGFSGDMLFFSDVAVPTAWGNYIRLGNNIRAIAPVADGLFVGTDAAPYLVVGSTPDNMVHRKLESDQACLSGQGMVDMGQYALYPGPEGLVRTNAQAPETISKGYFTKEAWQALEPETMRAFKYDNKYLAFFGDATDGTCLVYDPSAETNAFYTFTGFKIRGGYTDPDTGELHVIYQDENSDWRVGLFGQAAVQPMTWQGREEVLPYAAQFRYLRVQADLFPVTVTGLDPAGDLFTIIVNDDQPYALPKGYKSRYFQLRLEGTNGVDRIMVSTSLDELQ